MDTCGKVIILLAVTCLFEVDMSFQVIFPDASGLYPAFDLSPMKTEWDKMCASTTSGDSWTYALYLGGLQVPTAAIPQNITVLVKIFRSFDALNFDFYTYTEPRFINHYLVNVSIQVIMEKKSTLEKIVFTKQGFISMSGYLSVNTFQNTQPDGYSGPPVVTIQIQPSNMEDGRYWFNGLAPLLPEVGHTYAEVDWTSVGDAVPGAVIWKDLLLRSDDGPRFTLSSPPLRVLSDYGNATLVVRISPQRIRENAIFLWVSLHPNEPKHVIMTISKIDVVLTVEKANGQQIHLHFNGMGVASENRRIELNQTMITSELNPLTPPTARITILPFGSNQASHYSYVKVAHLLLVLLMCHGTTFTFALS